MKIVSCIVIVKKKVDCPYFGVVVCCENVFHYVRHRTVQFLEFK